MAYELLLSPMKIGTMTVRNRTVMTVRFFTVMVPIFIGLSSIL